MNELALGIEHLEIEQLEERIAPCITDCGCGGSLVSVNASPTISASYSNVNASPQTNVFSNYNDSYTYQYNTNHSFNVYV
jgi:hypothetical protein